jgi:hypothetical protein
MKCKIIVIAGVFLLVTATYFYITRVPLRGGYLGAVSVALQGYQTNQQGQLTALIDVTNGGPHVIRFAIGTQVLQYSNWVDSVSGLSNHSTMSIDPNPLLSPGANRTVSVMVPAAPTTWRVYMLGQKEYPNDWLRPFRWISDGYILKKGVVEHFYSTEVQR